MQAMIEQIEALAARVWDVPSAKARPELETHVNRDACIAAQSHDLRAAFSQTLPSQLAAEVVTA